MKIILNHDLNNRSDDELRALFIHVSRGLAQTKPLSPERRNALASLETISQARMEKMLGGPAP